MSEAAYLSLLREVLEKGKERKDRTGVGTRGLFGGQLRFDLRTSFPLLTTKKVHLKSIIHELLWFVRGETRVEPLQKAGVTIWDEWATAEQTARFGRKAGDLGPVYGHQWRNFGATKKADGSYWRDGVDQLAHVVKDIQGKPFSRRLLVTGWNPKEADEVALPPCHKSYQFHVSGNRLSGLLYQRSCDVALGLPFNLWSAALFIRLLAQQCDLEPGELVWVGGDVHLYRNHAALVEEQLSRRPVGQPRLEIMRHPPSIFDYDIADFSVTGYAPQAPISAPIAV